MNAKVFWFFFSKKNILPFFLCGFAFLGLCASVIIAGLFLAHPAPSPVGPPPPALGAQSIQFVSSSGATLHGWIAPGRPGGGVVVLMHGVRANRLQMLDRALVLQQRGFGVLLFDFQAHGESVGNHITFGYREGMDAASAVDYVRRRFPAEHVGVIGVSLGGAAFLLGPEPLHVDALVLESVYPDIHKALFNRLHSRLGGFAGRAVASVLSPFFEVLMPPILGVRMEQLRPIDRIASVVSPILIASGSVDAYTPEAETLALFARAPEPKQLWMVQGAGHVDLERFDPKEYWTHILPFLLKYVRHS